MSKRDWGRRGPGNVTHICIRVGFDVRCDPVTKQDVRRCGLLSFPVSASGDEFRYVLEVSGLQTCYRRLEQWIYKTRSTFVSFGGLKHVPEGKNNV